MAARKAAKPPKNTARKTARRGPQRDPATGRVSGGNPGNKGGTGRPPSEIRAAMRRSLDQRLVIAEQIADDTTADHGERLKALDFLAKYGMGTQQEVTGDAEKPQELRVRFVHEDTL